MPARTAPRRPPAGATRPAAARAPHTAGSATSPPVAPVGSVAPATTLPARSSVLVEVLNGTGVPQQATEAAAALQTAGFAVDGTGNAESFEHPITVVAYPPGGEADAETLAAALAGTYELRADSSVPPGVVDLVTGSSWAGLRS